MQLLHQDGEWEPAQPGVEKRSFNGERMTYILYRFAPGARFPLHRHAQEQIVLLQEGSVTCHIDGRDLHLTPGTVLLIPDGTPHSIAAGQGGALLNCILSPKRTQYTEYELLEWESD